MGVFAVEESGINQPCDDGLPECGVARLNDQWQADPAARATALYNHGSTIEAFGDLVIQARV